jgi:predicted enzyme related to lactoylglutathione lyase
MSCSFGFTKLVVADLEAMTDYYCAVYGMTELDRIEAVVGSENIVQTVLTSGPGSLLLLIRYDRRKPPEVGEVLLGFFCDNVDETIRRCETAGGQVLIGAKTHSNLRNAFLADPEGHITEVVELLAPSEQ